MSIPRLLLTTFIILILAISAFFTVRRYTTDSESTSPRSDRPSATETGCGLPIERYDEETLHRAYEMTLRMSEPDASPMWDDEQLRLSLTDPRFVAELERHFCEMEAMLAE